MIQVIVDIETKPLELSEIEKFMPDFKPAGNIKDPEKKKEDVLAKQVKFVEQAALNPLTAEICGIGIREVGKDSSLIYHSRSESELITVFTNLLLYKLNEDGIMDQITPEYEIITFNGWNFDIPFLCRRAAKYGKNIFPWFFNSLGRPSNYCHHVDLASVWDCSRKDFISLSELTMFFGGEPKPKTEELFWQVLQRSPEEAEQYLKGDLDRTLFCAQKMGVIKEYGN